MELQLSVPEAKPGPRSARVNPTKRQDAMASKRCCAIEAAADRNFDQLLEPSPWRFVARLPLSHINRQLCWHGQGAQGEQLRWQLLLCRGDSGPQTSPHSTNPRGTKLNKSQRLASGSASWRISQTLQTSKRIHKIPTRVGGWWVLLLLWLIFCLWCHPQSKARLQR